MGTRVVGVVVSTAVVLSLVAWTTEGASHGRGGDVEESSRQKRELTSALQSLQNATSMLLLFVFFYSGV